MKLVGAKPTGFELPVGRTALIMIDMQRDFVEKGGYGYLQCNSDEVFSQVSNIIEPCKKVLEAARTLGITVIHTREGHEQDLRDLPPSKKLRQYHANPKNFPLLIGDDGPMGKLLVRGEYGHDIIDALKPLPNEIVVDKPGKGTFYNTDIHQILVTRGLTHILLCGVTTECCVATTFREANDHGFECCTLVDCTNGFNDNIVTESLNMFCAYDGLLGYIGNGKELVELAEAGENLATPIEGSEMFKILEENKYKTSFADVPFTIKGFQENSNLVKSIVAKGGKLTEQGLFTLAVDNGDIETDKVAFTPSLGMMSLHNSDHSIYSSVCILANTLEEAKYVFVNERWFDEDDEMSKQYYEYPIKHIDYRGAPVQYSSQVGDFNGQAVDFDWSLFDSVYDHKNLLESHDQPRDLLIKRRKIINQFQPVGAPKVLVVQATTKYNTICRLLGFPSIIVKDKMFISEFGLDGMLLDITKKCI